MQAAGWAQGLKFKLRCARIIIIIFQEQLEKDMLAFCNSTQSKFKLRSSLLDCLK